MRIFARVLLANIFSKACMVISSFAEKSIKKLVKYLFDYYPYLKL